MLLPRELAFLRLMRDDDELTAELELSFRYNELLFKWPSYHVILYIGHIFTYAKSMS